MTRFYMHEIEFCSVDNKKKSPVLVELDVEKV